MTPDMTPNLRELANLNTGATYVSKFDKTPINNFYREPVILDNEYEFEQNYPQYNSKEVSPELANLIKLINR